MDNQSNMRQQDNHMPAVDLGPLSWIRAPLHDVLSRVRKNLMHFSSQVDADATNPGSLNSLETTDLRLAERDLHDAVGVLNLVGYTAIARVVAVMERCVQHFVSNPALCTPQAVGVLEQNINAVFDYLDSILNGHAAYSVGLFPAYRELAQLAGLERIHPADLWPHPWAWLEIANELQPVATQQNASDTSFFENVLAVLKSNGSEGIATLAQLATQSWQRSTRQHDRVFWQLVTGYLQLLAANTLLFDVYNKHLLSRIALQYGQIGQGNHEVPEQLAQDLLFFNALGCSKRPNQSLTPIAQAIAQRYAFERTAICDYSQLLYGWIDPALREKLLKEITHFKELWSDVSAGDLQKVSILHNEAQQLAESLNSIWPDAQAFTAALLAAVNQVQTLARVPHEEFAIEMAIAILFLEKSLEDLQDSNIHFSNRAATLAKRMEAIQQGQQPPARDAWMDEFYIKLNSKDSTEQVITESRAALAEVEQALDSFFRHPQNTEPAQRASGKLVEISSILMILGCTEASQASSAMATQVQQLLAALAKTASIDDPDSQACVLRLGNNLSALSFMLETMHYQPERARQQFYFDKHQQQLVHHSEAPAVAQIKPSAKPSKPAPASAAAPVDTIIDTPVDEDLRDIFLEEAAEVIDHARAAILALQSNLTYIPQLTNLRRAFHTLKGSGRMVGLASFGEAAWQVERILNTWLADGKAASEPLLQFASSALDALTEWRTAIAEQQPSRWHHRDFKQPAAAIQEHGTFMPIVAAEDGADEPLAPSRASEAEQQYAISLEPATKQFAPEAPALTAAAVATTIAAEPPSADIAMQIGTDAPFADSIFGAAATNQSGYDAWLRETASPTAHSYAPTSTQTPATDDDGEVALFADTNIAIDTAEAAENSAFNIAIALEEPQAPVATIAPVALPASNDALEINIEPTAAPFADSIFGAAATNQSGYDAWLRETASPTAHSYVPASKQTPADADAGEVALFADSDIGIGIDTATVEAAESSMFNVDIALEEPQAPVAPVAPVALPASVNTLEINIEPTAAPFADSIFGAAATNQSGYDAWLRETASPTAHSYAPTSTQTPATDDDGEVALFADSDIGIGIDTATATAEAAENSVFNGAIAFEEPQAPVALPASESDTEGSFEQLFAQPAQPEQQALPSALEQAVFADSLPSEPSAALFADETATPANASSSDVFAASIDTFDSPTLPAIAQIPTLHEQAEQPDQIHLHAPQHAVAPTADTAPAPNMAETILIDTSAQRAILQEMVDGLPDDEIRHIGDFAIPLALFNAYLNEADTWSRQLQQEMGEWALEFTQPAPDSLGRLAHSLVGSSATVGMSGLASITRGIEHALMHLKNRTATPEEAQSLLKATEKVRQELHQFAAGIARPVDMEMLHELASISATATSATALEDADQKKNF